MFQFAYFYLDLLNSINQEKIEVEELKKLTKENIIEFFNNYIKVGGAGRKKVSVYINPAELTDEYKSKINVIIFKKNFNFLITYNF